MENNLIDPYTCKCGQLCVSYTYQTPNYDDGGKIDSFSTETIYLDECAECIYEQDAEHNHLGIDDLPF